MKTRANNPSLCHEPSKMPNSTGVGLISSGFVHASVERFCILRPGQHRHQQHLPTPAASPDTSSISRHQQHRHQQHWLLLPAWRATPSTSIWPAPPTESRDLELGGHQGWTRHSRGLELGGHHEPSIFRAETPIYGTLRQLLGQSFGPIGRQRILRM